MLGPWSEVSPALAPAPSHWLGEVGRQELGQQAHSAGALLVPLWCDLACHHPLCMSDSFMKRGAVLGCHSGVPFNLEASSLNEMTLNTNPPETSGTEGTQNHLFLWICSRDLSGRSGYIILVF